MKMYLFTIFVLILLGNFINGDQKYQLAELRAELAKAKSIEDALIAIKVSGKTGRSIPMISRDLLKKEQEEISKISRKFNKDSHLTIEPRNGGCEPRIECVEIPVNRTSNDNKIYFPQCIEVHRCGGCCQEGPFSCAAAEEKNITFGPLVVFTVSETNETHVTHSLTLTNHTKCECKCDKEKAECRGKILHPTLCECIEPECSPRCHSSSPCSVVPGTDTQRCTCGRPIPGQWRNYCSNPNERPNYMCKRCEIAYG